MTIGCNIALSLYPLSIFANTHFNLDFFLLYLLLLIATVYFFCYVQNIFDIFN